MRYRKKPLFVDAVQYKGVDSNNDPKFSERPAWINDALARNRIFKDDSYEPAVVAVQRPNNMRQIAQMNDYIIQDSNGDILLMKPDIFAETYDKA